MTLSIRVNSWLIFLVRGSRASEWGLSGVGLLFQGVWHPAIALFNANPGTEKMRGPAEYFAHRRVFFLAATFALWEGAKLAWSVGRRLARIPEVQRCKDKGPKTCAARTDLDADGGRRKAVLRPEIYSIDGAQSGAVPRFDVGQPVRVPALIDRKSVIVKT